MKSFKEFIFECYNSGCFLCEGRYKQESAFIRLFRQARGSKDWSKAAKLMDQGKEKEALELMQKVASSLRRRISDARNNPSSPLNYGRSDAKEYVKGKDAASEESFYDNLDAVADAVAHAPLEKKFRSAVTSKVFLGRQLFGTGTDIGRLTQLAQDAGIKSQTSTADFKLSSPRDSTKGSVGGSLKGGPAQIATAEPGDFRAAVQYAAQSYAENEVPETERNYEKKRQEIIDRLVSFGNEIAAQGESQRIPKDRKSENKPKVAKAQSVLTKMYDDHPGFDSILSKTFASGSHRFQEPGTKPDPDKDVPGTASLMVHTPEPGQKGKEFSIEPISKMEPVKGRASQGRGATKPKEGPRIQRAGTVRFDVNAPEEGEGTLSTFRKRVSDAQKALADAEREQADASVIKYPDGTPVPRKNQYYLQNNPDAAQQHAARQQAATQAVQQAQTTIADIETRAAQAREKSKPQPEAPRPQQSQQPQRTEPVDTKPQQPVEKTPEQPIPQSQPETPEQKKRKRERTEAERSDMRRRMDSAGQAQGLPEYA